MKAWICLGSNLNKPEEQLQKALKYLREKCYFKVLQAGTPIVSKPYGYTDQPDFVNQLLQVETLLTAQELLCFVKSAEKELGRVDTFKWGPRTIDIDIILYENEIIKTDDLQIPHPGIVDREYLLKLLSELIPDYIHPELNKTIKELYSNFHKEEI
jgi:2-amino-4-hydroxy-6-hydroxymethyldihydropteridine diphosphokinase